MDQRTKDILNTLSAISAMYARNRRVGHTHTALHGVFCRGEIIPGKFSFIARNQQATQEFKEQYENLNVVNIKNLHRMISPCEGQAVVFDNAAICDLCAEAAAAISEQDAMYEVQKESYRQREATLRKEYDKLEEDCINKQYLLTIERKAHSAVLAENCVLQKENDELKKNDGELEKVKKLEYQVGLLKRQLLEISDAYKRESQKDNELMAYLKQIADKYGKLE
jgi:hypothetical protein